GFSPTIRWLERQPLVGRARLPRWAAILVFYFGLLGLLAGVVAIVLPPLAAQASELWQQLPNDIVRLQGLLVQRRLLDHPWTIEEVLKALPGPTTALGVLLGALQGVIGTIGTVVAILVLPYYLLIEADSLQSGFLKLFPPERRGWIERITHDVTFKV